MESEDPLSQLADIHLPDPVSTWPLAPGWWLVIALMVVGLCWLAIRLFRRAVLNKRLQAAQNELEKSVQTYRETANLKGSDLNKAGLDYLYSVNAVLNRVALYTSPNQSHQIAKLSGQIWLEYLDQSYGGNAFTDGPGKVLAEGQYRPIFSGEVEALYTLTQEWINSCYKGKRTTKSSASNIEVAA